MTTLTKVFKSGNSQAIRLPKDFHIDCKEITITQFGDLIILRKPKIKQATLENAFHALTGLEFDEDVLDELSNRNLSTQERESF